MEEGALLRLGLLEGDEDGWAETLGVADGELEGTVDGSDEGLEEGALLRLGLLEDNEDGWAETLGVADTARRQRRWLRRGTRRRRDVQTKLSSKATKTAGPKH